MPIKPNARILVIDDEPRILRFLQKHLQLAGYTVQGVPSGIEGLDKMLDAWPDLILLDLGLPDVDGLEVLRRVRCQADVPVIILTARDDEDSMVTGLRLGADDYLTKPFSGRELQARIEAVLRRYRPAPPPAAEMADFESGPLSVDMSRRQVTLNGEPVRLTPVEFELLAEFIRHPGKVRLHCDLLAAIWGQEYRDDVTVLRAAVYRLRQKIEPDPTHPLFIKTEAGVGYIFL